MSGDLKPVESDQALPPIALSARISCAGWWLLLAASIGYGLWCWTQYLRPMPLRFGEPDAGLDAVARVHFGIEHGAAVLRREIALAPSDRALLVIGPGDQWTLTESYFLISYLAWPRPVWCIGMMPKGQAARFENPPPPGLKPAEVFFYNITPPAQAAARPMSDRLAVSHPPE